MRAGGRFEGSNSGWILPPGEADGESGFASFGEQYNNSGGNARMYNIVLLWAKTEFDPQMIHFAKVPEVEMNLKIVICDLDMFWNIFLGQEIWKLITSDGEWTQL